MAVSIYELKLGYLFKKAKINASELNDLLLVDSGRSALFLLLQTLQKEHGQLDVYVNAYTTDVVHTTIRSLGVNLIPYDIDPYDFRARVRPISTSAKLVFIQTGLFGFNCFDKDLYHLVKEQGGYFIEDCCNSFGSIIEDQPAGSYGDAAIYSFRVGKALSSGGGALKVNNEVLKKLLMPAYQSLMEISPWQSRKNLYRVYIDYLLFEPFILTNISRPVRALQKRFSILNGLVQGGVVDTLSKVDASSIHKMGPLQIDLALKRLYNFDNELKEKKVVSDYLSKHLEKYDVYVYSNCSENYKGWNYLFFPILLERDQPDEFIKLVRKSGFDATRFHFESPLKSFPDLSRKDFSGTFKLIDKLVVIPNTTRMRGKEEKLVNVIDHYFSNIKPR